MRARINSILAAFAGCLAFALISLAAGSVLAAPCGCTPPPTCCAPPTPPAPPNNNCCQPPGHTVNVPGVNVFVGASVIVNANVSAQVSASAAGSSGGSFFVGGGGGGGFVSAAPVSLLQGLNVGGDETRRTAYESSRTKIKKVIIEAVCIDDKDVPHPASQVTPDRDIEDSYDGELYRCIAGSHMQVTIADYSGQVSFDHGQTMACLKDQALYHSPGGKVECAAQKPARDCNERSLLRRFGAGVKILTMITIEKYTAYREETTQTSSASSSMTLDGGVGGVMN
jgi:hypothetical protein